MTEIKVERVGGFGGFGLPGSRIQSKGRVELGKLSEPDRAAIEDLFDSPRPHAPSSPDAFRYRLTRDSSAEEQTVEVPEHQVPQAVRECVRDELK
jgi:emfourin